MSSISGSISFAGLGNGTDFGAMIKELKKVEEIPKARLETWQKDWKQRYEAFDTLYTQIKALQETFSKVNMAALLKKEVGSTTPTVATAKAGAKAVNSSHSIDVSQIANNAVLTCNTIFKSKDAEVFPKTPSGDTPLPPKTFSYEYKGERRDIEVHPGTDLQTLVDKINNDPKNPGVKANLVKSGNGYMFQLQGKDTGAESTLKISSSTAATFPMFGSNSTSSGSLGPTTDISGKNLPINTGTTDTEFVLHYVDPKTGNTMAQTITVKPGQTAQGLADIINSKTGETGIVASFDTEAGTNNVSMRFESTTGKPVTVHDGNPPVEVAALTEAGVTTTTATEGTWNQRIPQDAKFTIDGIPTELTSASNTLTEVFDDLTVTLLSEGKTNLNVTTSTDDMKSKIEEVVKETNTLLAKINELTKVSSEKTQSSITNEDGTPNYGSQTSFQMGSVLTGNYGVQLLTSRLKGALTSQSIGSKAQEADASGKLIPNSGDLFTSFSSIGIVFDAEQGSPTYGQLKFLTDGETTKSYKDENGKETEIKMSRTLDEALKEDPLAVADMLVGSGGVSDSADFDYVSHISGNTGASTKPGTYKVSYTVAPDGTVEKVYVDGVEAVLAEGSTSNLYEVPSGNAKGLAINLNNLSPGKHEGDVRIKQGKITQITGMLNDELAADEISKDSPSTAKRGSIVILKDNYMDIMKNIQTKIDRETERIAKWERTQKLKFARLDALLGKYDKQMSANAASFAQLDGGA